MSTLTEKLGDNLQKIRGAAEDAFISVTGHREFGIRLALSYLCTDAPVNPKPVKKGAKKPVTSNRLLQAKYQTLYKMLCSFQFNKEQQATAAKYAVKGLENS